MAEGGLRVTPLIYLASPYSHKEASVRAARYQEVLHWTTRFLQKEIVTFSPIVYSHQMSEHLGTSFDHWKFFDETMLRSASHFVALTIEGWQTSKGLMAEARYAQDLCLPLYLLNGRDELVTRVEVVDIPE